jgi:hypothetical protein
VPACPACPVKFFRRKTSAADLTGANQLDQRGKTILRNKSTPSLLPYQNKGRSPKPQPLSINEAYCGRIKAKNSPR